MELDIAELLDFHMELKRRGWTMVTTPHVTDPNFYSLSIYEGGEVHIKHISTAVGQTVLTTFLKAYDVAIGLPDHWKAWVAATDPDSIWQNEVRG